MNPVAENHRRGEARPELMKGRYDMLIRIVTLTLVLVSAVLVQRSAAQQGSVVEPAMFTVEPLEVSPDDDELLRLLKERHNAALRKLQSRWHELKLGIDTSVEELIEGA